jgi:hypothetical protein
MIPRYKSDDVLWEMQVLVSSALRFRIIGTEDANMQTVCQQIKQAKTPMPKTHTHKNLEHTNESSAINKQIVIRAYFSKRDKYNMMCVMLS